MNSLMRRTIAIFLLVIITTSLAACVKKEDESKSYVEIKKEDESSAGDKQEKTDKNNKNNKKIQVISKCTEICDGNKEVTEYKFNKYGEIEEEKYFSEVYNIEKIVTYTYDEQGNKIEISSTTKEFDSVNPDEVCLMMYEYNNNNNLVKCEENGSLLEEYKYNENGKLETKKEYRGGFLYEQKYEYDDNGNLVKMEERMESEETPTLVEEYAYNSDGTLLCITGVVGNIGPYKKEYDKNGNCLKYEIYNEDGKTPKSLEEYNYNENGDMIRYQYYEKGWGLSKDELGMVQDTVYEYNGDELHKRLVTEYDLSYDDNNKVVIDVCENVNEYVYEYEYKEIEVEER